MRCEGAPVFFSSLQKMLRVVAAIFVFFSSGSPSVLIVEKALKLATTFCVLSKHDPEQKDITQLLYDDKNLETLGAYRYRYKDPNLKGEDSSACRALLKLFIRQELINWPAMKEQYTAVFNSLKVFQDEPSLWDHLQSRVIEHVCAQLAIASSFRSSI